MQPGDGHETHAAPGASWLDEPTRTSLTELNELSLALMAEQGAARPGGAALLRQVAELWRVLDGEARLRAAACPYLLLDAGFAEPQRWRASATVWDAAVCATAYFNVPRAAELVPLLFTFAWHLVRSQGAPARLLLGMSAPCAALIARCSLRQVHELATQQAQWLRPRWPARIELWRELLLAAAGGETVALERARLRGLTLLAAEVRSAASG